ncbi:monooxygenase [Pediococcus acidilactici]|uniref:monooxygenase n=1 Tax=Pediococcus acidilactici TaxID=1254 RepID=UPI0019523DCD|nr:monooxygenase [Pediococcus acidilactici]MBM6604077.1 monooxygenase [Pediococcus acidilactici]MBM6643888.1 monooxygenase [Pediococcus acidilactici]
MFKTITTSFGSSAVLKSIQKKYSSRKLLLLANQNDNDSFQLVDFSNQPTIFKTPQRYTVLNSFDSIQKNSIFTYHFFELSTDTLDAFDSQVDNLAGKTATTLLNLKPLDQKPYNRAILEISQNSAVPESLQALVSKYRNQNYYKTNYQVVG